jgi:hypothetical protein
MLTFPGNHQPLGACRTLSPQSAVPPDTITLDVMHKKFQINVGKVGDQELLTFVHNKLGMPWTKWITDGAIIAGNVAVLQWLHAVVKCPMSDASCWLAAMHRHHDVLKWLQQNEIAFQHLPLTFATAAVRGYIDVMQCLLDLGYTPDDDVVLGALIGDSVDAMQWLHEHKRPWDVAALAESAVHRGSINIMQWLLQQHGATLDAALMKVAAAQGKLAMCRFLRRVGCAWDESACYSAAKHEHIDVLTWLRSSTCPCDDDMLLLVAACRGSIVMMQYNIDNGLMQEELTLVEVLSAMLLFTGAGGHIAASQWLRQQDAEWPQILSVSYGGTVYQWSGAALAWARAEGCTSPLTETDDTETG